jgi:hypothetical protein
VLVIVQLDPHLGAQVRTHAVTQLHEPCFEAGHALKDFLQRFLVFAYYDLLVVIPY